jgi:hypothetical protein
MREIKSREREREGGNRQREGVECKERERREQ